MVSAKSTLTVQGIDPSLLPLIFRPWELNDSEHPELERRLLPKAAAAICKFAGLLVQAYWFLLKSQKREQEVPDMLEDILLQIWAGHQKYLEGTSISVLREASMAPATSSISQLVREPELFIGWGRLLSFRERRIKEFDKEALSVDWHDMFSRLIRALPVLGSTSFDGERFVFGGEETTEEKRNAVPAFPFIRKSGEVDNALLLYAFEQVQTKPRIIFEDPYSDYTEDCELEDGTGANDSYQMMRRILGFQDVRQGMLYLFGSGYEHIQNLALAIARADGENCKEALAKLLEAYSGTRDQYDEISLENKVDFVILVLADHGPTKILKELLDHNRSKLMEGYLNYLEGRKLGTAAAWRQMVKDLIATKKKSVESYLGVDEELKREVIADIELEAMCWGIITAAGLRIDSPRSYVESIDMRLRMIKEWSTMLDNVECDTYTIGLKIEKLVERTMKFLICFYSGLKGYYESYERDPDAYDEHEEIMLARARAKYVEKNYKKQGTPGDLFGEFTRLAKECSNEVTDRLLGRKMTCNMGRLQDVTSQDYVGVWNRLKHDKRNEVKHAEIKRFVVQSFKLFNFFRNGRPLADETETYTLEPIYPMVISFRESHRKRDGLMIYNYEIYSLGNSKNVEIRILTPREYVPNEEYYCIPLYNRSTKKWWLDPFLIRCSKFDGVFD